MNDRKSVATIDKIQFIDLQPSEISPLMTKADLKVCYIGQNRNNSFIDRSTAAEMAKTLRGCPIVGWYIEDKEDFGDHGDQLVINGEGATFTTLTKPYGFVAPDAKVWFQFFEDTDEFGNTCLREYLMTQCFLWTEQFPECKRVVKEHNPHSMELDEDSLRGHWAEDSSSGMEYFIINDAIFSKLCILGEDVEPCFEGSCFLPESNFSLDSSFVENFSNMIKEFRYALKNSKGGTSMEGENTTVETVVEGTEAEVTVEGTETETIVENSLNSSDESNEMNTPENENITEEFSKEENKETSEGSEDATKENNGEKDEKSEEPKTKHSLEDFETLQKNFEELQEKFSLLEKEKEELLSFKLEVEDKQKDELINSFYMLSEEDKEDVIKNKATYSLDDIEKELSVICVRKKVNFNEDKDSENSNEDALPTTYNLDYHEADDLPAWLKSVENVKNRNK